MENEISLARWRVQGFLKVMVVSLKVFSVVSLLQIGFFWA